MPLFVIISGFLNNTHKKICQNINKITETFLISQAGCIVLLIIWGGQIKLSDLFTPYWTLWYLLSLIFWKTITYYLSPILSNNMKLIFTVCIFLSIISGYIPHGRIVSIQRTISFYPFFLYGYYIRIGKLENFIKNIKIAYIIIIAAACIAIFLYKSNIILTLEKGGDPYQGFYVLIKAILLPCSLLISLSIWTISHKNPLLSLLGKKSLSIYVYHTIFIVFIFIPIAHHIGLPRTTFSLILYCILLIFLLAIWSKTKLSQYLLNPLSNLK